jgi:hypothetical protein
VKHLVTEIAKALVDIPEEVTVREVIGEQVTVLELRVAPTDLGKAGADGSFHQDAAGCRGNETEAALYAGDFGVTCDLRRR